MKRRKCRLDTSGLSAAGLWVRRQLQMPSLSDEAVCLAQVVQLWNLGDAMSLDHVEGAYAEVSGLERPPTWIYLIEILGRKSAPAAEPLVANHPLSQALEGEEVRIVALIDPQGLDVEGALVETAGRRRMLWLSVTRA